MQYPSDRIRYKHYGKHIELLIEQAIQLEEDEKKEEAIIYLGRLMKALYTNWNKDSVDDEKILQHLSTLSRGTLSLPLSRVREENLFQVSASRLDRSGINTNRRHTSGGYKGNRKNKRNNKKT